MKKIALIVLFLALSQFAHAITPFTITDIRVEGLQRLDAGTVFNYLPLKVGDEVNDDETRLSIKELFKTGFFKDVSLEQDGTVLVVRVVERPSIASITFKGNDKLKTEDLEQGLEQAGMVEGRIFNVAVQESVERDIKNTYLSMGRYSATVDTITEELDQNRVAITVDINEGRVARIKKINIIGAEAIPAKKLKDEMLLKEKRGMRLFSRQDQYSKQQLEADLESIRSYYLNRGYHEFEIVSSNVEISPNKQNIFIGITVEEGELFSFGESVVEIEGVEEDIEAELQELITIETGQPFSRQVVNETRSILSDRFADDRYAFVDVRPVFNADKDTQVVDIVFSIIPNQRVHVRRIDISGNQYTRDEVIRRELRQFEGAWYSASAIRRSKERLQRLGIFGSVQIETPPVAGTTDEVDMKVLVTELDTGSILLSAGFSDEDGVLLGVEFEQRNLVGTGKTLSLKFNNSDAVKLAVISYTDPYHTQDGISRGFHLTSREVDSREVDTAAYILNTDAFGVLYKIPIAETNTVNLGAAFERIELEATPETPPEYLTLINSKPKGDNVILTTGLSKDNRDEFFFPTRGAVGSASLELAAPGSDYEYYKFELQGAYYQPLGEKLTIKGGAGIGVGDGFGDSSEDGLPFFKNYFAGGAKSVRGYNARSLGPKDTGLTPSPIGGDTRVLANIEVLFPAYGAGNTKDKRFGIFADSGMVYGNTEDVDLGNLRYSTGVFFNWFSAIGPFTVSYGYPIDEQPDDDIENIQISVGTVFQ
jgi:outer membrane protein insertion porin family